MVILDVIDGQVRFVEALDRPELQRPLEDIPVAPRRDDP
jgi:hypothetical protein